MARHSTTRLHVSGYRFLLRRMEPALVRGDLRMLDDPLRAQSLSLVGGVILALIIVAACVILAFLRPPSALGGAQIVMVRDSGALYVRTGDVVHPVLNLASARLIAGTPADPDVVSASAVHKAKRGPLVGIPGAPVTIAAPFGEDESGWPSAMTRRAPLSSPGMYPLPGSRRDTGFWSRRARKALRQPICCTTAAA